MVEERAREGMEERLGPQEGGPLAPSIGLRAEALKAEGSGFALKGSSPRGQAPSTSWASPGLYLPPALSGGGGGFAVFPSIPRAAKVIARMVAWREMREDLAP